MSSSSPLSPEASALLATPVLLQSESFEPAIRETMQSLSGHPYVQNLPLLVQLVLEREHRASTATEGGVAFPHARATTVTGPVLAMGLSEDGVLFDQGKRVNLILVVAVPPDQPRAYLDLIAHLVRQVREHPLSSLLGIRTASDFRKLLAL